LAISNRPSDHYVRAQNLARHHAGFAGGVPTKLVMVIDLKTAKELGLIMPPTLLFQTDKVIR